MTNQLYCGQQIGCPYIVSFKDVHIIIAII